MESLRVLPNSMLYKKPETFQNEAKEWANNFRKQTFDEDVIPYIHGKKKNLIPVLLDPSVCTCIEHLFLTSKLCNAIFSSCVSCSTISWQI